MDAGALAFINFAEIYLVSSKLDGNSATVSGGAFLWSLSQLLHTNSYLSHWQYCSFTGNVAGVGGGAAHISVNNVNSSPDSLLLI